MEKTILVLGRPAPLAGDLVRRFCEAGLKVVYTEPDADEPVLEGAIPLPSPANSPLSPKNLLWDLEHQGLSPQDVWLVWSPPAAPLDLEGSGPGDLGPYTDQVWLSWAQLLRELWFRQDQAGGFRLFLVFPWAAEEQLGSVGSALFQAQRHLASQLLGQARRLNRPVWGFECASAEDNGFLDFILAHPTEGDPRQTLPGRWLSYGEKRGLSALWRKT